MTELAPNDPIAPALSVVLATPGNFDAIRLCVTHLQRQSICNRIELIIVASSCEVLALPKEVAAPFAGLCVVEVGDVRSVGHANAVGARVATAPVVAFSEDHAFPAPDWGEALVRAHEVPRRSVVAPCVENANPRTSVSRADFVLGYGPWGCPVVAGERHFLPGHNSSYKRAVLLELGDHLEAWLASETLLHWELRAQGHSLYLEPQARVRHVNFSRWKSWLPVQFHQGRLFAASRAANWSRLKRLFYTLASPLIPLVRLSRTWNDLQRIEVPGRARQRTLLALLIGLVLDGLGQCAGYAGGMGNSQTRLRDMEFHRVLHLTRPDQKALRAEAMVMSMSRNAFG